MISCWSPRRRRQAHQIHRPERATRRYRNRPLAHEAIHTRRVKQSRDITEPEILCAGADLQATSGPTIKKIDVTASLREHTTDITRNARLRA